MESAKVDRVLAQRVVDLLNSALERDPVAVSKLIETRVECNEELAAHPTIQVIGNKQPTVGLLGLLNGLVGIDDRGWGIVRACYEDHDITRVIRFDLTPLPGDHLKTVDKGS